MATIDSRLLKLARSIKDASSITKSFGRAWKFREKEENKKNIVHPTVVLDKKRKEHFNLRPNDRDAGISFFYVRDTARFKDYTTISTEIEYTVDLILWFNSLKIDEWKGLENELIKIREAIKLHPAFKIDRIFYEVEAIYDGFTLDEAIRQYFSAPYFGAKIRFSVIHDETECFELDPEDPDLE